MTQLTFIQGGLGAQRIWQRTLGDGHEASAITVLNGRSRGGGLRDSEGAFSIKWIPRGRAVYRVEGTSHALGCRRALILNPDQPYELAFPEGRSSETLCVFFSDDLVHDAWASLHDPAGALDGEASKAPAFPDLVFVPDHDIVGELDALHAAFELDDPSSLCDEPRMLALLERLLTTAQQHRLSADRVPVLKPSTRRSLIAQLQRARDFIDDSPAGDPSLAALARESALSKFHFLRLFKAVFGCTPGAYAQAHRVERATALLASTTRSVGQIAEDLGYDNATSLIRAFKRHTGQTPGAYRGEIRNLG
jgi:AraC-like DNA-binding protein